MTRMILLRVLNADTAAVLANVPARTVTMANASTATARAIPLTASTNSLVLRATMGNATLAMVLESVLNVVAGDIIKTPSV